MFCSLSETLFSNRAGDRALKLRPVRFSSQITLGRITFLQLLAFADVYNQILKQIRMVISPASQYWSCLTLISNGTFIRKDKGKERSKSTRHAFPSTACAQAAEVLQNRRTRVLSLLQPYPVPTLLRKPVPTHIHPAQCNLAWRISRWAQNL